MNDREILNDVIDSFGCITEGEALEAMKKSRQDEREKNDKETRKLISGLQGASEIISKLHSENAELKARLEEAMDVDARKLFGHESRKRHGCDCCRRQRATEKFYGFCGNVLWICHSCFISMSDISKYHIAKKILKYEKRGRPKKELESGGKKTEEGKG